MDNNKTLSQNKVLQTAGWRTFLDKEANPRAERFLENNGYDVLNQITSNINKALDAKRNWDEIALLVHPNSSTIMLVKKEEFSEVLIFCMEWFKEREYYEMCSFVLETQNKLNDSSK
jgi:hypothetical protein